MKVGKCELHGAKGCGRKSWGGKLNTCEWDDEASLFVRRLVKERLSIVNE